MHCCIPKSTSPCTLTHPMRPWEPGVGRGLQRRVCTLLPISSCVHMFTSHCLSAQMSWDWTGSGHPWSLAYFEKWWLGYEGQRTIQEHLWQRCAVLTLQGGPELGTLAQILEIQWTSKESQWLCDSFSMSHEQQTLDLLCTTCEIITITEQIRWMMRFSPHSVSVCKSIVFLLLQKESHSGL